MSVSVTIAYLGQHKVVEAHAWLVLNIDVASRLLEGMVMLHHKSTMVPFHITITLIKDGILLSEGQVVKCLVEGMEQLGVNFGVVIVEVEVSIIER